MARLKAQLGDQIPADRLERIRANAAQRRGAAEAGITRTTARNMAFAVLQVTLRPDQAFRSSRVDDMTRSPLPDWLDMGIASYAAPGGINLRYLQEHLDEAFPLDDVDLHVQTLRGPFCRRFRRTAGDVPDGGARGKRRPSGR